jgi:predicted amidohydrolase YtcJ
VSAMPTKRSTGLDLRGLRAPWALLDARVWTGVGALCEAVAANADGRIASCGSIADVLEDLPSGAELVDARGAFVCPGFVDPHVHVRAAASAALATDVSRAVEPEEIVTAVRDACRGPKDWVTLVGSRVDSPLTGGAPDRCALDRVSRGAPVRIRDRSGHGWLLNSAALRALGVDLGGSGSPQPVPAGVTIERHRGGLPTGFVADHVGWVGVRAGRVSAHDTLSRAVRDWSREQARRGVVALCDTTATNGPAKAAALLDWRERGTLRQEVTFLAAPGATLGQRARPHCAGTKFADASDPRLPAALRAGGRVAVHCVDPSHTAAVLQAAAGGCGPLRIEHASFVPPDWVEEVARVGATIVTHPSFVEAHGDRYLADPDLAPHHWLYRLASWSRAGVPLAFGSDAPFGPADPLTALRDAARRRTAAGATIGSHEALTGDAALRAITVEAAACSGLAPFGYGRVQRGGPAALAILDGDPRNDLDSELLATVIGSDVVD